MAEASRIDRPFLTARWQYLAMLNYEVPSDILAQFVPTGTELDQWQGRTFVSLVGFRFLDTRVLGIPIPFHRNFEELNLRFYVKRIVAGEVRRGVVFVKELVPRWAIAFVARTVYGEPYQSLPMRHAIKFQGGAGEAPQSVCYEWYLKNRWHRIGVEVAGQAQELVPGSEQEFITEHYWGYTKSREGKTSEYRVEHPRWRVWDATSSFLEADVTCLYGPTFAPYLIGRPSSAFLADGSAVSVSPHHQG